METAREEVKTFPGLEAKRRRISKTAKTEPIETYAISLQLRRVLERM